MNYPKCSVKLGEHTELNISNNIGANLVKSMNEAENYIHIISPYISSGLIKHLKKLKEEKPKLDIKILFSDRSNFLENPKDIQTFKELIKFSWKENPEKIEKRNADIKKLKRGRIFFKFFFLLLLLIPIAIVAVFHIPQLKYLLSYVEPYIPANINHSYAAYTVGGVFLFLLLLFFLKMSSIKKKINILENISIEDPDFTNLLDFKCVECYEKSSENFGNPAPRIFPHAKIYLMDFKPLNRENFINKVFIGSSNFIFTGLNEKNIETLIESKDVTVCRELRRFFDEMYDFNFPLHSKEEIGKTIYKEEILEK